MHAREDQHGVPAAKGARPARRPAKAPPSRDAAGLAPPGASVPVQLAALQGLVGNQVVARTVAEDRHEHGAGCGHEVSSVQRSPKEQQAGQSSLLDALRSPGRPLEPHIRQRAEQGYNMSFEHVRQHDGPVAQRAAVEFGARAMTIGSDIIIGPQGADDETKFHELDHVHWNAQGRPVEGSDNGAGVKVSYTDAPSERQATANSQRLARGDAPELGFPGAADAQASAAAQRTRGEEAAQRHVHEAGCGHGLPVQRAGGSRRPDYSLVNTPRNDLMGPQQEDQERLENVFPKTEDGEFERFPNPVAPNRVPPDPVPSTLALVRGIDKTVKSVKRVASKMSLSSSSKRDAKPGDTADSEVPADWVMAINSQRDEGHSPPDVYGPYRRNCTDAVRSFLASWSGNPTAAAGIRAPHPQLEDDGSGWIKRWLHTDWRTTEAGDGDRVESVWSAVERRLMTGGHGSSGVVVFKRADTGFNHAVAGVNHMGRVVWVDPQVGRVSETPLYSGILFSQSISLTPGFTPIDPPAPNPLMQSRPPT
jgi:papain fold toxin 1 (glutamine deamidase) of polymorphic toxin system/uncharacterized protein DUF4157